MVEATEIIEKIEVDKEILTTMPKNNHKNITQYLERIQQLKEEYENFQNEIEKILTKRYKKETEIEVANEVANYTIRTKTIENILSLISDEKTSYEKMELDKIIYRISRFYKDSLENINVQIEMAIRKFSKIGINLQPSDFKYSIFVEQYMDVFFKERKNEKSNSKILTEKFEEIYWKCPDIIIHIELSLRNIYLQKQAQIDKYYEKEKEQLLKKWGKTTKEIMNSYFEIKAQKTNVMKKDRKLLLDSFLTGKLNTQDYTDEKISNSIAKVLSPEMIEKIDTNRADVQRSICEFLNSLYEYKNYLNYQYIIEDVKKYYQEKEKYKRAYEDTKKRIIDMEKKLKKLNKKSLGGLFRKNKQEMKQSIEQNNLILKLKNMYKELDQNKFYNKIYTNLNDNSTIYDVLNLANSYYNYLTKCLIENNKIITQEKIDEQVNKLDEFVKEPSNNIINNMTFTDDKDIAVIIKDRYKLLNFNIKQEDLNSKNIDNLIKTLENIIIYFNLKDAKLEITKIEELLKIKNVL